MDISALNGQHAAFANTHTEARTESSNRRLTHLIQRRIDRVKRPEDFYRSFESESQSINVVDLSFLALFNTNREA